MPFQFYKVMHIFGFVMLFTAMGGSVLHALNGGTRESNGARGLIAALHGIALALILTGGFGMMARLGMMSHDWPGWIYAKVGIWLLLPFLGMLAMRRPAHARTVLVLLPFVGLLAAWIAIYKPF
jgi:hypothetical protein